MDRWEQTCSRTEELYSGTYHCCEAIVKAVSEHFQKEDALFLKISTPFGGGLSGNGDVCGSLMAAYLCLGIFKGRSCESESRSSACDASNRIYQKFIEKYKSTSCAEIIGYNKKDPREVELYGKKRKCEFCIPLAKEVTKWVLEELKDLEGLMELEELEALGEFGKNEDR